MDSKDLKHSETPIISRYVFLMRFFAVLYFLLSIIVFFFHTEVLYLVNFLPRIFAFGAVLPEPGSDIWLVPTSSYLITLSALSILASLHPQTQSFALVHMFSALVSVAGFLYLYIYRQNAMAYALGAVLNGAVVLTLFWSISRITLKGTAS